MKRKISIVLCLLICAANAAGCQSDTPEPVTTSIQTQSETEAAEPEYIFPELDMKNADFVILQRDANYDMYNKIDVESMNGDLLDDAVWLRNNTIKELYNVNIVQKRVTDANAAVSQAVMSGDNLYQAAYPLTNTLGSLILEGMFWDLNQGSGFNFDKPWWDSGVIDDVYLGGNKALYFANSDLTLLNFEATWCMYFNRNMLNNLQLELPYQLVKDGKWTYDELYKYISAGANLNGDDSFTFNKEGKAVYGFTSMDDFITQAYVSCDAKQIQMIDCVPTLMTGGEKLYNVTEKLAGMFSEAGTAFFANDRANGVHYELVFGAGRALFSACEIKGCNGGGAYSEMKDDYGIVPMPKYDENQKSYISPIAVWTYFLTVPVSNPDIETASVILDTMSYLSYKDIVPVYYDTVLQVKHIRDDETKDMLDIIRGTRTYFTAYAFGWGVDLRNGLISAVKSGKGDAASLIASVKDSTELSMSEAMEKYNKASN